MTSPNSNGNRDDNVSRWWALFERLAIETPITLIALYLMLNVVGDVKQELRAIKDTLSSVAVQLKR